MSKVRRGPGRPALRSRTRFQAHLTRRHLAILKELARIGGKSESQVLRDLLDNAEKLLGEARATILRQVADAA